MALTLGRVLALDVGDRRTGVAMSDSNRAIAMPRPALVGLVEQDLLVRQILELVHEEAVSMVVVGLPVSLNGTESSRADITRRFVAYLAPRLDDVKISLCDERLTTVEAARSLRGAGLNAKKQKSVIDSASAVVLLESWLACQ
jgi:putative Holliday junction resolvase